MNFAYAVTILNLCLQVIFLLLRYTGHIETTNWFWPITHTVLGVVFVLVVAVVSDMSKRS